MVKKYGLMQVVLIGKLRVMTQVWRTSKKAMANKRGEAAFAFTGALLMWL